MGATVWFDTVYLMTMDADSDSQTACKDATNISNSHRVIDSMIQSHSDSLLCNSRKHEKKNPLCLIYSYLTRTQAQLGQVAMYGENWFGQSKYGNAVATTKC